LACLNLAGLGIDYLRFEVQTRPQTGADARRDHQRPEEIAAPHWPLGLAPPDHWSPLATTAVIAGAIIALALVQNWLRYRAAVSVAHLTQKIVVQLRCDVYDKLQRLSFRFFDQHESGSIINRVTGD